MPLKPTRKEDEYFVKEDAIKLRKIALQKQREMTEKQRQELKQLHWMHCPKCGMEMKTILLNDVEVDKCFACGGLYFDEGELEKVAGRPSEFFKTVKDVFTE